LTVDHAWKKRLAPQANQTGSATTTTTYTWDLMHRPTGVSYTDGTPSLSLSYDQASALSQQLSNYKGQLTYAATSGTSTLNQAAFSYDNVERVAYTWSCTPITCGTVTQEIGATYNHDNSLNTFTDYNTFPNRTSPVTFSYSYNTAEQVTGVSSNYTPTNSFPATLFTVISRNAFGEPTNYTYGTGTSANTTVLQYDKRGRNYSRTNGTLYSYSLSFYANGSIQSSSDSTNGAWQYGYDSFGRLSSATETSPSQTFAYQYDQYGNRWGTNSACSSTNVSACQYQFNLNNHITNGGVLYDAAGNMTYDGIYTYTYDAEGRIAKVSQGSNNVASYVYDAFGHRTQESVGSSTYAVVLVLFGRAYEKLAYTQSAGEFFQQTHLFAGRMPIGFYQSSSSTSTGTTEFFINDWKGTLSQVTAVAGGSDGSCSGYLPFGDSGTCTGTGSNWGMPRYAATWNDPEAGLDKTDTRFLSPIQGRFLTPDPARSGWNLYVYGNNDPVSNTDPGGLAVDSDGDFGSGSCGWGCTNDGSEPDFTGVDAGIFGDVNPNTIIIPLRFYGGDSTWQPFGANDGPQLWEICNLCSGFYSDAPDFLKREIFASYAMPFNGPVVGTPDRSSTLNGVKTTLDIVGFIPVVGDFANLASAGISVVQGNYGDAGLSLLAAIPVVGLVGEIGKGAELVKDAEILTRFGEDAESAARLGRKALEAEGSNIAIHGVSATAAKVEGNVSTASRASVEQYFTVHNTGTIADPLHRTIELPKPVTQPIAVIFNKLFGRL
jgi:RHS repeat-associated protein